MNSNTTENFALENSYHHLYLPSPRSFIAFLMVVSRSSAVIFSHVEVNNNGILQIILYVHVKFPKCVAIRQPFLICLPHRLLPLYRIYNRSVRFHDLRHTKPAYAHVARYVAMLIQPVR